MSRGQAPGERSLVRKTLIAAALPLALLAAVIVQLTVVNRLPLPGGDGPDLVLLLVTAVAVRATPPTGAIVGFAGGLALDVAPPQTHYAGEYALVFCLAGYAPAPVPSRGTVQAIARRVSTRCPAPS
jgi:rod shape-determining protein MreD